MSEAFEICFDEIFLFKVISRKRTPPFSGGKSCPAGKVSVLLAPFPWEFRHCLGPLLFLRGPRRTWYSYKIYYLVPGNTGAQQGRMLWRAVPPLIHIFSPLRDILWRPGWEHEAIEGMLLLPHGKEEIHVWRSSSKPGSPGDDLGLIRYV